MKSIIALACLMVIAGAAVEARPKRSVVYSPVVATAPVVTSSVVHTAPVVASVPVVRTASVVHSHPTTVVSFSE